MEDVISLKSELEKYVENNDIKGAIEYCEKNGMLNLGYLISLASGLPTTQKPKPVRNILVKPVCNWCSSQELCEQWNFMSQGNYTWNSISLTWKEKYDYIVVININYEHMTLAPEKTILMQMNPGTDEFWVNSLKLPLDKYLKVYTHKDDYSNIEWTLKHSYSELIKMEVSKTESLSIVLPYSYEDRGHRLRIDFAKFLNKKQIPLHVFGNSEWGCVEYKKGMSTTETDDALFPYKYTIAVEDKSIKNYISEKLINGILAECLVFYNGAYNVKEYIDENAFVYLELSNFEEDAQTVSNAIKNNLYEQKLPYIKKAKERILNELQFFPRLEKFLTKNEKKN